VVRLGVLVSFLLAVPCIDSIDFNRSGFSACVQSHSNISDLEFQMPTIGKAQDGWPNECLVAKAAMGVGVQNLRNFIMPYTRLLNAWRGNNPRWRHLAFTGGEYAGQ